MKSASAGTHMITHGCLNVRPARTGSPAGITSTPFRRTASGAKMLFPTTGAEVGPMSPNQRLTLNQRLAFQPMSRAGSLLRRQRKKLLSKTSEQPGKVSRLNLQLRLVAPLPPPRLPQHQCLPGKVSRLNPAEATRPVEEQPPTKILGVPVGLT